MALARRITEYLKEFPEVKNLKIRQLSPSEQSAKNKRFRADFIRDGRPRRTYFGQPGAFTFFDGASREKRAGYIARAKEIRTREGRRAYRVAGSPASFAMYILW